MNRIANAVAAAKCITDEIRKLHDEINGFGRKALDNAIRIGELLTQEKAKLDHGEWLPWVQVNMPFTDRTARNYIRCFEKRDRLKSENVSDLAEAYRLLAPPPDHRPKHKAIDQAAIDQIVDVALHIFTSRGWPVCLADILSLRTKLAGGAV